MDRDPRDATGRGPVLVLAEHDGGAVGERCREALTAARALGVVHALWLGTGAEHGAPDLATFGAEVVHVVSAAEATITTTATAHAVTAVARAAGAAVVLLPTTPRNAQVAALVAHSLGAGLVIGASDLRRTAAGSVATTQHALAATWRVRAEVVSDLAVVTLLPHAVRPTPAPTPAGGHVRQHAVPSEPATRTFRVLERTAAPTSTRQDLATADVVVAGGRGTQGDFGVLAELAEVLGGAVGATGVATEEGWAPREVLIGQSGVTVAPRLYLGAGVSGAVHHRAGMEAAGTIVAIDLDPDAPIFEIADFGVVGDLGTILPQLVAEVRRLRS